MRAKLNSVAWFVLGLCVAFSCPAQVLADPVPTDLLPGKPIKRPLSVGEQHVYRFSARSGEYGRIEIRPLGHPLEVLLSAPDGSEIAKALNEAGERRLVTVSLIASVTGNYEVELHLSDPEAPAHEYEISLAEIRAARPDDHQRVDAESLFAAAKRLQSEGTKEGLEEVIRKLKAAIPLWQAVSDPAAEGRTQETLGDVYLVLGRPAEANKSFNRAFELAQAAGDAVGKAGALVDLGVAAATLGETKRALEYYQQAVELSHTAGDGNLESDAQSNLGQLYQLMGDPKHALECASRARDLKREIGDRRGEMVALSNMGSIYSMLGEPRKALDAFDEVLPYRRKIKDQRGEALTLLNMATAYSQVGELHRALESYQQSLPLSRAAGDKRAETIALSNMGVVQMAVSDPQGALDTLNRALQMGRETNNQHIEESVLSNIGRAYLQLGEPQRALVYSRQALEIQRKIGDKRGEGAALANVGTVLNATGEPQQALDVYRQALPLLRAAQDRSNEADTLNNMGALFLKLGDIPQALEQFDRALELARATDDLRRQGIALINLGSADLYSGEQQRAAERLDQGLTLLDAIGDRLQEARGLYFRARLEAGQSRFTAAREDIDRALKIDEDVRATVVGQELRSSYFSTVLDQYDFRVALLMNLDRQFPGKGYGAQAFETSERARARSLLDLLTESGADIRQGVDPELLSRERTLSALLRAKAQRQIQSLATGTNVSQAAALEKDLQSLTMEYQELQAHIRSASPRYAALVQPQPLSLAEIQREVVGDPNTTLLEYAIGEDRSFVWVVTKDAFHGHELPKRSELEALARRAYTAFRASGEDGSRVDGTAISELGRVLLGPVAAEIGTKRLLIVAAGALQYVPFAALPEPHGGKEPLIVRHEVVNLPSASTLALIRREVSGRKPAPKMVAVLADPVFSADDPRVTHVQPAVSPVSYPTSQERGIEGLNRLSFTRTEAQGILELVPNSASLMALDFDASRATATGSELGQYRFVHLASHGVLNARHPELSGIVLSLVDRMGSRQNGFLEAHEIYNLKLNADLVVLSACETALGQEIRGEGLVGLTRGFIYAGAPRVVASLWSVPDRSTAELMRRFYRFMLIDKLRPADALRRAQVSFWEDGRWSRPYYWAAFSLQGEWN